MEDNNFIILRNFREITHLDYRSDRFYLKRESDERFLPFTIIKVLEIKKLNLDSYLKFERFILSIDISSYLF